MSEKRNATARPIPDGIPRAAGELVWERDGAGEITGMQFACPCGCGANYGARWGGQMTSGWAWNGSVEKPTVTPSLGCYEVHGPNFHWHGYLTDGEFAEC